jgi:glutamate synthase (NADPH/NADH) small chain
VSAAHEEGRELARQAGPGTVPLPLPETDDDVRVFSASTMRFEGDAEGHVRALHLADAEPGTRRPVSGTERWVPADLVLLALGFSGPEHDGGIVGQLGIGLDERGTFARDENFAADSPGVFVAGDAGRGQSLIVWAIAEGRSAAAAVDRYLTGMTELPAPIGPTDRPLMA